ncbi:M20 family metallopeptidase [Labrys monachus]|uniref:Probable succinyl-diaminopimelate desuccinylase n=1 Tax=Labrys monachus TaxID=217067 RepID=A0ABU0FGZ4_9HYPH|nr:M20 family metallopeptidase [Labrys monachus]MDQ0393883.1 acetylornithine deacetylase/succinyl-diaminopimelate desuccinylase [Labrys monachus]
MQPAGLLERLVAFDTQNPPGDGVACARFIGDVLAGAGFAVAYQDYRPNHANIVARLSNGEGPVFALNTHIDVVPAGEGWSSDPFRAVYRDGRIQARGACDAKGSLAAMMTAGLQLARQREAWSGTLLLVFVGDEEVSSSGAKHFAAAAPPIDYAVIGEPTSNRVVTAHKGSLRPLVRVRGRTAHSGAPHLGVNAVFGAAHLLAAVEAEAARIARFTHPLCGPASLTVTRIAGGQADNVVPDSCDMLLDRRMVPGETPQACRAGLEDLFARVHREHGTAIEVVEWRETTGGPTETPADNAFVRAALRQAEAHGAAPGGVEGLLGACDLVHFNAIGALGIVLGPGDLAVAHKPDEFVPLAELEAAAGIYRSLALDMLRHP